MHVLIALVLCAQQASMGQVPIPKAFPVLRDAEIQDFYPFETTWVAGSFGLADRKLEFLGVLINKVLSMVHTPSGAREFLDFYLDNCTQTSYPETKLCAKLENAERLYWLLVNTRLVPYVKAKKDDSIRKCLNSHELFVYTVGKVGTGGAPHESPGSFLSSTLARIFGALADGKVPSNDALASELRECLSTFEQTCEYHVGRLSENPPLGPEHSAGEPMADTIEHFRTVSAKLVQEALRDENRGAGESSTEVLANDLGAVHSFMSMVGSFCVKLRCVEDSFAPILSHFINKCTIHVLRGCSGSFADFYVTLIDFYDRKLRPAAKEDGEIRLLYCFYLSEVEKMYSKARQNGMAIATKLQYLRIFLAYESKILDKVPGSTPAYDVAPRREWTESRLHRRSAFISFYRTAQRSLFQLRGQIVNFSYKLKEAVSASPVQNGDWHPSGKKEAVSASPA